MQSKHFGCLVTFSASCCSMDTLWGRMWTPLSPIIYVCPYLLLIILIRHYYQVDTLSTFCTRMSFWCMAIFMALMYTIETNQTMHFAFYRFFQKNSLKTLLLLLKNITRRLPQCLATAFLQLPSWQIWRKNISYLSHKSVCVLIDLNMLVTHHGI